MNFLYRVELQKRLPWLAIKESAVTASDTQSVATETSAAPQQTTTA